MTQHTIRQQSYARQEASLKAKFIEDYFKEKYGLEDLSKDEIYGAINKLEGTWRKIENELTLSEDNKSNDSS